MMYWQDLGRPCQDILTIGSRSVYYYNVRTLKDRFTTNKVIYLPFVFTAGDKNYPEDDDQIYYPSLGRNCDVI